MVSVPSTMVALGTSAPEFALPDPTGTVVSLDDIARGRDGVLVVFLCNHCPYVKHIGRELALLTQRFVARNLGVAGINANDAEAYPEDGPEAMAAEARALGYDFAYLIDADQQVAKAYGAACTPDFFLYDADRRLVYRGQFDAARPSNDVPVTGADLRAAVDALLSGEPPLDPQRPSMGCNIKWRAGNEPEWFGT
jgi:peroxiredoxin